MQGVGRQQSDSELIDLIYGALLGEASWQDFLDRLSRGLPNGKAAFFFHDSRAGKGGASLASGVDGSMEAAYADHYSTVNVWMPRASLRRPGIAVIDAELFPREELINTEYFNDFLCPYGVTSSSGLTIDRGDGFSFMLTTLSDEADLESNRRSADQLGRLAPHLKRASDHYRSATTSRAASELGASLFDAVDIGIIIIGDKSCVKAVSDTCQAMLREEGPVAISPFGKLRFRDHDAQVVLNAMLERAYEGPKVVSRSWRGTRLTLICVEKDRISLFFEGPTVVVLMQPLRMGTPTFDIEQFALRFGLSRAETRALLGILDGRSISQIADEAVVSRETIRSQLKSLYAKTGTRSQMDVLRLVHAFRH